MLRRPQYRQTRLFWGPEIRSYIRKYTVRNNEEWKGKYTGDRDRLLCLCGSHSKLTDWNLRIWKSTLLLATLRPIGKEGWPWNPCLSLKGKLRGNGLWSFIGPTSRDLDLFCTRTSLERIHVVSSDRMFEQLKIYGAPTVPWTTMPWLTVPRTVRPRKNHA
jgi:hypothetical protein